LITPAWRQSPPGDTIGDLMEEQGWKKSDLAFLLGLTMIEFEELLDGQHSIDIKVARELENSVGGSAIFWLKREENYDRTLFGVPGVS